jgi:hypothetical protein
MAAERRSYGGWERALHGCRLSATLMRCAEFVLALIRTTSFAPNFPNKTASVERQKSSPFASLGAGNIATERGIPTGMPITMMRSDFLPRDSPRWDSESDNLKCAQNFFAFVNNNSYFCPH